MTDEYCSLKLMKICIVHLYSQFLCQAFLDNVLLWMSGLLLILPEYFMLKAFLKIKILNSFASIKDVLLFIEMLFLYGFSFIFY